jgi:hypothetical protein
MKTATIMINYCDQNGNQHDYTLRKYQKPAWLNIAIKPATNMMEYSDENSNQHDWILNIAIQPATNIIKYCDKILIQPD